MGKLIVLEGIDGCGKSSVAFDLTTHLTSIGKTVKQMAFPSHEGPVGKLIRKIFAQEETVQLASMLYLLLADGADFDAKLSAWRDEYDYVICDRHPLVSGWAYQVEDFHIATVVSVQQQLLWVQPDLTTILDIDPEAAMSRWKDRNAGDDNPLYERDDVDYHQRLRQRYQAYALLNPNCIMLDATAPVSDSVTSIVGILKQLEG